MTKVNLTCPECEADFKVLHDMNERMYVSRYCTFCGEEIVTEDDELNFDGEDRDD